MPTPTEMRRLYNALVGSQNIAYGVLPDGAAAITCTAAAGAWTWGAAWATIIGTVGAADVWIAGVAITNPSAPASDYDVALGIGAAPAEVAIAQVPYYAGVIFFPYAIRVAAGTRLSGNTRSSSGAADTIAVKAIRITGL